MNANAKDYIYKIDLNSNTAPARMLRMVEGNKRVLEIGCAAGNQTRVLAQDLGCNVTAIEYNESAAESARPFCQSLIIGDIETINLDDALGQSKFDVITLGDVLEHLRDPLSTLRKIQPFLEESGFVVASIPNFVHASIVFEMCHGRFDYRQSGLLDDTHVHFFTRASIARMFEEAGYFISKFERFEMRPEHTEFKTRATHHQQDQILKYIIENNSESLTYQFVLKAVPLKCGKDNMAIAATNAASDRITELEHILNDKEKKIAELESNLQWINRGFLSRIHRRFFLRKI